MKKLDERINAALAWIDAELKKCLLATKGPWKAEGYDVKQPNGGRCIAYFGPHHTPPSEYPKSCKTEDERNGAFIASARAGYPAMLQGMKVAINTFIVISQSPFLRETDSGDIAQMDADVALGSLLGLIESCQK